MSEKVLGGLQWREVVGIMVQCGIRLTERLGEVQ